MSTVGNLFSPPKPQIDSATQAALNQSQQAIAGLQAQVNATPATMPTADDAAVAAAQKKAAAQATMTSGRQSTFLTKGKLGDNAPAETRSGYGSTILTG